MRGPCRFDGMPSPMTAQIVHVRRYQAAGHVFRRACGQRCDPVPERGEHHCDLYRQGAGEFPANGHRRRGRGRRQRLHGSLCRDVDCNGRHGSLPRSCKGYGAALQRGIRESRGEHYRDGQTPTTPTTGRPSSHSFERCRKVMTSSWAIASWAASCRERCRACIAISATRCSPQSHVSPSVSRSAISTAECEPSAEQRSNT